MKQRALSNFARAVMNWDFDFFNRGKPRWCSVPALWKAQEIWAKLIPGPALGHRLLSEELCIRVQNNFLRTAMRYWHYWHQAEFCHICLHRPRAQINSTECQGKSLACSHANGPDCEYSLLVHISWLSVLTRLADKQVFIVLVAKPSRSA